MPTMPSNSPSVIFNTPPSEKRDKKLTAKFDKESSVIVYILEQKELDKEELFKKLKETDDKGIGHSFLKEKKFPSLTQLQKTALFNSESPTSTAPLVLNALHLKQLARIYAHEEQLADKNPRMNKGKASIWLALAAVASKEDTEKQEIYTDLTRYILGLDKGFCIANVQHVLTVLMAAYQREGANDAVVDKIKNLISYVLLDCTARYSGKKANKIKLYFEQVQQKYNVQANKEWAFLEYELLKKIDVENAVSPECPLPEVNFNSSFFESKTAAEKPVFAYNALYALQRLSDNSDDINFLGLHQIPEVIKFSYQTQQMCFSKNALCNISGKDRLLKLNEMLESYPEKVQAWLLAISISHTSRKQKFQDCLRVLINVQAGITELLKAYSTQPEVEKRAAYGKLHNEGRKIVNELLDQYAALSEEQKAKARKRVQAAFDIAKFAKCPPKHSMHRLLYNFYYDDERQETFIFNSVAIATTEPPYHPDYADEYTNQLMSVSWAVVAGTYAQKNMKHTLVNAYKNLSNEPASPQRFLNIINYYMHNDEEIDYGRANRLVQWLVHEPPLLIMDANETNHALRLAATIETVRGNGIHPRANDHMKKAIEYSSRMMSIDSLKQAGLELAIQAWNKRAMFPDSKDQAEKTVALLSRLLKEEDTTMIHADTLQSLKQCYEPLKLSHAATSFLEKDEEFKLAAAITAALDAKKINDEELLSMQQQSAYGEQLEKLKEKNPKLFDGIVQQRIAAFNPRPQWSSSENKSSVTKLSQSGNIFPSLFIGYNLAHEPLMLSDITIITDIRGLKNKFKNANVKLFKAKEIHYTKPRPSQTVSPAEMVLVFDMITTVIFSREISELRNPINIGGKNIPLLRRGYAMGTAMGYEVNVSIPLEADPKVQQLTETYKKEFADKIQRVSDKIEECERELGPSVTLT